MLYGGGVDILSGGRGRDVFHFAAWWDHSPVGQYDVVKDFSFRDGDKIGFYRNCDLSVGQTRDGNLLFFLNRGTIKVDRKSLNNYYSGYEWSV